MIIMTDQVYSDVSNDDNIMVTYWLYMNQIPDKMIQVKYKIINTADPGFVCSAVSIRIRYSNRWMIL